MSLDNIQLQGFLCSSMYKNSLVDLSLNRKIKTEDIGTFVDFLGGNNQKILFVTKDSHHKFLGDDHMKFLNDFLNACNLTLADIGFVNISGQNGLSYHDLMQQLSPKKIFVFGLTTKELEFPFEIPFFQVQNFNQQVYVFCPSLEKIQLDKELKKQLWTSAQKIFNIQKPK